MDEFRASGGSCYYTAKHQAASQLSRMRVSGASPAGWRRRDGDQFGETADGEDRHQDGVRDEVDVVGAAEEGVDRRAV